MQISTPKGKINISKEVIAHIASTAAMECYGLAGVPSNKLSEGLTELIKKETTRKGVKVEVVDGNRLIINIGIVVIYGTKISEVAQNVMEKVHYTIEEITGAKVEKVNIKVLGVKVVD
ncbi:MAG: Asp23/Gls24 family envelope stress response protein [Bacillota bacterium]